MTYRVTLRDTRGDVIGLEYHDKIEDAEATYERFRGMIDEDGIADSVEITQIMKSWSREDK